MRYAEKMGFHNEEISQRHCNVYGCTGIMRPTRTLDNSNMPYTLRLHRCTQCENQNYWLAFPEPDCSYGELHMLKGRIGHSGGSMQSDPKFYPPAQPKHRGRRTR